MWLDCFVCVDGPMTHFHGKLTNLQYNTRPNSFALKPRRGSRLWDSRTSPFICYNWVRHVTKSISKYAIYISRGSLVWFLSRMLVHIMHHCIRMHKLFPQVGITTIQHFGLTYAFDGEQLLGHLIILKILLPRMPHLDAQTGCRAGRRRTCRMDHQTHVRASSKADGSSG